MKSFLKRIFEFKLLGEKWTMYCLGVTMGDSANRHLTGRNWILGGGES